MNVCDICDALVLVKKKIKLTWNKDDKILRYRKPWCWEYWCLRIILLRMEIYHCKWKMRVGEFVVQFFCASEKHTLPKYFLQTAFSTWKCVEGSFNSVTSVTARNTFSLLKLWGYQTKITDLNFSHKPFLSLSNPISLKKEAIVWPLSSFTVRNKLFFKFIQQEEKNTNF